MNNVDVKVLKGELYKPIKDKKFNSIIVNPPQTAGKKVCHQIIEESLDYLEDGGILQLVVRHQKGGKSLMAKMNEVFGNAKDIAKKSGYRVYISVKPEIKVVEKKLL